MHPSREQPPRRGSALLLCSVLLLALLFPRGAAARKATTITIGGTGCALGTMRVLAKAYQRSHHGVSIRIVPSLGSGGGIRALLAGAIDIALSARPLTRAEEAAGATAYEYGRTPFVFATANPAHAVSLSPARVVAIYAGEARQWPDKTPIRLILRPETDTDTALLEEMSPEMDTAVRAAFGREGLLTAATDQDNAALLMKIPGAFGALTLAQIISEKRQLHPIPLGGVRPDRTTIADGSYPYAKALFAVTGPRVSGATRRFIAFLASRDGRAILARIGYLTPQAPQ